MQGSFDACLSVAMRNANVYFDATDTSPEHLRKAISVIGAQRILFGSDLSGASVNYAIAGRCRWCLGGHPGSA